MLQRFYVNNYRCFENFELHLGGKASTLLLGKNSSGKSTVAHALSLMQGIGRGVSRVGDLLKPKDIAFGKMKAPVRFELDVLLEGRVFSYSIAFELPDGFREMRVFDEQLVVDGATVYTRKSAEVQLLRANAGTVQFPMDWHKVALTMIQPQSESDPLTVLKEWLAQMIILTPNPSVMTGDSDFVGDLQPERDGSNFGNWFSGLMEKPAAYETVRDYLREIMPDLESIESEKVAKDAKTWFVNFSVNEATLPLAFDSLSDGEKCFFLCAMVLAANRHFGPIFCFWDEPDNFVGLSEVADLMMALRRAVRKKGQLLVTSHSPQGIGVFPKENIIVLGRKSHLEPARFRCLSDLAVEGDVIEALIRGDVEI